MYILDHLVDFLVVDEIKQSEECHVSNIENDDQTPDKRFTKKVSFALV